MEMQPAEARGRQVRCEVPIGMRARDQVRNPRASNPERVLMMGFRPEESACSPSIDG